MWIRLWKDDSGFVISLELTLTAILVALGLVAGLQALRDAATQELADMGMAIGALNNSYSVTGLAFSNGNSIAGSSFTDTVDSGDTPAPQSGDYAGGMSLGLAPMAE